MENMGRKDYEHRIVNRNVTEEKTIRALRAMAWERAKGELRSMYHTFYSDSAFDEPGKFGEFEVEVEAFITRIEHNGLHE